MMNKIFICISVSLLFSACTWVNENKSGRDIAIVSMNDVNNCQKMGNINVSVKHKIGIINRGKTKVLKELQILARNEGVNLGANRIAPNSDPIEGKQTYQAFICP
jgi:hypothetical protein